jgi:hypothetical protein
MEAEHCRRAGSQVYFVTGNYNIRTCPANEWAITVCGDFTHADMRHERRLEKIEESMKTEIVLTSGLIRCEVIAVVLYTGPMVKDFFRAIYSICNVDRQEKPITKNDNVCHKMCASQLMMMRIYPVQALTMET